MDDKTLNILKELPLRDKAEAIKVLRRMIDEELAQFAATSCDDAMAHIYLAKAAAVCGIKDARANSRTQMHLVARAFVAKTMRDNGATLMQIARATGTNHATVVHTLEKINYDLMSGGDYDFDLVELWQEYQQMINIQ